MAGVDDAGDLDDADPEHDSGHHAEHAPERERERRMRVVADRDHRDDRREHGQVGAEQPRDPPCEYRGDGIRIARGSSLRATARRACMAAEPYADADGRPTCSRVMQGSRRTRARETARNDLVRFLDSYASLLVLLLANFLLLEIVDDARWGAVGSTVLAAVALVVAISDPATGHRVTRRHWLSIAACVALAPLVLLVNRASLVGLTYLLPVGLLVTATLPITLRRILRQKTVTYETMLGALCTYVLLGLLFAFVYLAVNDLSGPFFAQDGPHTQSEYLYFSFVTLTTLGFGDLSPQVGLPQGLTVLEALTGQVFLVTMVARLVTLWGRQGMLDDEDDRARS